MKDERGNEEAAVVMVMVRNCFLFLVWGRGVEWEGWERGEGGGPVAVFCIL